MELFFLNGNISSLNNKNEIKTKIAGRFVIMDDFPLFNLNLIIISQDKIEPIIEIEKTKIRILETGDQREF